MGRLAENIAGTYQMTRAQMEAFAVKSNAVRDSGGWTTLRWRIIDRPEGCQLEEYETGWQKAWRPSEAEKDSVKAEVVDFATRYPWLTIRQYSELVDRYGNNIPERFEVEPPPLKKQMFLRREEFDRIVDERGQALSNMLDLGVIYRSRDGFTCHPSCRAQAPIGHLSHTQELR
jgi:hypothetical protein